MSQAFWGSGKTFAALVISSCVLLTLGQTAVLGQAAALGQDARSSEITIYDPDPNHLWNRLHATLFVRRGPDGKIYGEDRLEPLLWQNSQYLLQGEQAGRAAAVLEEFIIRHGERLVSDPLKRAVLQRDLWLVASWLLSRPSETTDASAERLLRQLAEIVHRIALTPAEIDSLPDNYAAAVASGAYAGSFDPDEPNQSHLPPDLFLPDGPWICVGRTDGPPAPGHRGEPNVLVSPGTIQPFTNSVFFVFLKLPAGRTAALTFLNELVRQREPMFVPTQQEDGNFRFSPNLNLPMLPIGSELALVRRALLIDVHGRIAASPLTESVQLRVTTSEEVPATFAGGLAEDPNRADAVEFELRRSDLFSGTSGGLRDVSLERDLNTGFLSGREDEFEVDRSFSPQRPGLPPFGVSSSTRRETCFHCHAVSNLYGALSFQRYWTIDQTLDAEAAMYPVAAMAVRDIELAAISWKEADPRWQKFSTILRRAAGQSYSTQPR